jgi:pimeloyl-ACP methyl ester carboxylesterase
MDTKRYTNPIVIVERLHRVHVVSTVSLRSDHPIVSVTMLAVRLIVLALLPGIIGCADQLLLHPSTDPVDAMGAKRREVALGNRRIEMWVARSPGCARTAPRAFALVFVGNASRAEWAATPTAQFWKNHPIEVWAVNYPGYGGSTGPAKLASLAPAALATYDAIASEAVGRPVFVTGESIGTTLALYVGAHRPVAGIVLKNPPPLKQLILGEYGWWNLWLIAGPASAQVPDEMDSVANAKSCRAPAIFLLAERDRLVLPKDQQMVVDAYAGERRSVVLAGAGHNSPIPDEALLKVNDAIDWLWRAGGLSDSGN